MTSTVLFIPRDWDISKLGDTQYQALLALTAEEIADTSVRGSWEQEIGRIAHIQKVYILAPWTGNPYHACEQPYVVVGEMTDSGDTVGTADVFIRESELPLFLDSIKDVLRVLKAKGRIRTAKWPNNFRG